ncbi:unnamed protein product [Rotaria magnacalcarata]|uniref:Uncharacterized protein n=1 Tax=Rotaria magnacalcarata TaxID=392030 RepID=A0A816ZNU4_9BILA|nr:unnamed protein product [Rotaria magnacalcarata]CAF2126544.1 unnamed protein product [Rotaria magnacalcarata]CAF2205372.1 unnamed protein product [Rotaria magnacalcarata]CAF4224376.1 unnamed protein product [Rotaria magnacalcarata]CAF4340989.1 unnamed protein product [Rotaria magnacalcarata]
MYFGFSDNCRMALNKDYEVEISDDSETIASEEFPSFRGKPATNIKEKNVHQSQKDVVCSTKNGWNIPKYVAFFRKCQFNKYFVYCSICTSDFCETRPERSVGI